MTRERKGESRSPEFYLELSRAEYKGINGRVSRWQDLTRSEDIDWLIFAHGCDDSRVIFPTEEQIIYDRYGNPKNTLFIPTKSIGGGITEVVPKVIKHYKDIGVSEGKMMFVTTQHGTADEIETITNGGGNNVTCGLRNLLKEHEEIFIRIRNATGEERDSLLAELSLRAGIPVGLLVRAIDTNYSADISENLNRVASEYQIMLKNAGLENVEFYTGLYDHNKKRIRVRAGTKDQRDIQIPGVQEWHYPHQNPASLVVSHGISASSTPDGVLLPRIVGSGENNDFGSASTNLRELKGALYEHIYALIHRKGHGNDPNFSETDLMIMNCDDDIRVREVMELLNNDEQIRNDFEDYLKVIGGVQVGNMEHEEVELIRF